MSWQRSQPTGLWMLPPVEGPVRNVEPSGRVPALRGDQLMKARIKQRIGVTDSHRDAIDHPVEQKETAPAFATESARFGALPWCEYESRERQRRRDVIRQRDAVKRQQHLGDDVERIKRLEYKQFSKLAVLMAKTSPTASSVSYDIINQCRFPGLYGQLLKHEENAKHYRDFLRSRRCEERCNGKHNILTWEERSPAPVPRHHHHAD